MERVEDSVVVLEGLAVMVVVEDWAVGTAVTAAVPLAGI